MHKRSGMDDQKVKEKINRLDELARPLHEFIKTDLPQGSFRTNQAWARLQECVNWATNSVLEGVVAAKKKKLK